MGTIEIIVIQQLIQFTVAEMRNNIDSKTVVFIRAYPGKKETIDGLGLHVNF